MECTALRPRLLTPRGVHQRLLGGPRLRQRRLALLRRIAPVSRPTCSTLSAIGGTSLSKAANARGWSEQVWNEPGRQVGHRQRLQHVRLQAELAERQRLPGPDGQRRRGRRRRRNAGVGVRHRRRGLDHRRRNQRQLAADRGDRRPRERIRALARARRPSTKVSRRCSTSPKAATAPARRRATRTSAPPRSATTGPPGSARPTPARCRRPSRTSNPPKGPGTGGTVVTHHRDPPERSHRRSSSAKREATSFEVHSDTSITAQAPAGAGTVDVTVTTPGRSQRDDAPPTASPTRRSGRLRRSSA